MMLADWRVGLLDRWPRVMLMAARLRQAEVKKQWLAASNTGYRAGVNFFIGGLLARAERRENFCGICAHFSDVD